MSEDWRIMNALAGGGWFIYFIICVLCMVASSTVLALPPTIDLLYPNEGGNITTRFLDINWTASDPESDPITVNIFLDTNNRSDDGSIQVASSEYNDGNFVLDLYGFPQRSYFVRVDAIADIDRVEEYSDQPFIKAGFNTTPSSNSYNVTAGAEIKPVVDYIEPQSNIMRGELPIEFNVTNQGDLELFVNIYHSNVPGAMNTTIASGLSMRDYCDVTSSGTAVPMPCLYLWDTSGINSQLNIDVLVTDSFSTHVNSSPGLLVTNMPNITITSPNGGESYDTQYINTTWTASDIANFTILVDIYLDSDSSILNGRMLHESGYPNTGIYTLDTGGYPEGQYYVSIDALSSGLDSNHNPITVTGTDYSDGSFYRGSFNQTFTSSFINNNYTVTVDMPPDVRLISPNTSMTLNESIEIVFNVTDIDDNFLSASLYYSSTPLSQENTIVENLDLTAACSDSDFSTETACTYNWTTTQINGDYYIDVVVTDSINQGTDSSELITINNIPVIENITIVNVTNSTVTLTWQTMTEPTNTTVYYNMAGSNLTQRFINTTLATVHQVTIPGLTGNKDYEAQIQSCDSTGLCAYSDIQNFTTKNNMHNVTVISPNGGETLNTSSANITWLATDPDNDSITIDIYLDEDTNPLNGRDVIASNLSNTGAYEWYVSGVPNGFYYISIDASVLNKANDTIQTVTDASDNNFEKTSLAVLAVSNQYNVTVVKNSPPLVTNVTVVNSTVFGNATISYIVVDDDMSLSAKLYYSSTQGLKENLIGETTDLSQDCTIDRNVFTCFTDWDTDAINGGLFLDVEVTDSIHTSLNSSGNLTVDNYPHMENITVTKLDPSTVVVRWLTAGEPADSRVSYTLDNNTMNATNLSLTFYHEMALVNLSGNALYTFWLESCDSGGKCTTSDQMSFITLNTLPVVTVMHPNGGEVFTNISTISINYTAIDLDNDEILIDIFYDHNNEIENGRILIATDIPNTGRYDWFTGGVLDGTYYVSIDAKSIDKNDNRTINATDYSDAKFEIGSFEILRTSNSYNVTVRKNTAPITNITAPKTFDKIVEITDILFTVQDFNGDALTADLSYTGRLYKQQIFVTNNLGQDVIGYPIRVTANTAELISELKLRPDAVNFKVLVANTEVPIFIESGFNTDQTKIWFELDMLDGQTRDDVFLVYGDTGLALTRQEPDWGNFLPQANVLLNKPVLSFSSEDVSFPVTNANDGNFNTRWRSTGTSDFVRYNLSGDFMSYSTRITILSGINHSRARYSLDNINFSIIGEINLAGGETVGELSFKPLNMSYYLMDQIGSSGANDMLEIELFTPIILDATLGAEIPGEAVPIVENLDLSSALYCNDPDSTTQTANNCSFTWNMSLLDGIFCIGLDVTDSTSTTTREVCNVTIDNINDFPVLVQQIPNVTYIIGTNLTDAFDLDDYFIDPNEDPLSYTVAGNVNITIMINPVSHNVSFSQAADFTGKEYVVFTAHDNISGTRDSNLVTVFVTPTPPNISGLPDHVLSEDSVSNISIDLRNFTTDQEINVSDIIFSITSQTNALLINCSITALYFMVCADPVPDGFGENTVTVSAFDGTNYGFDNFTVTVLAVNDPPIIAGIPDIIINESTPLPENFLDLFNYTSDVEDSLANLTFNIQDETNTALIDCSIVQNRYVNCTPPTEFASGSSGITINVTDTENATDADDFTITVLPVDNAPIITLIAPDDSINTTQPLQTFTYTVFDVDTANVYCDLIVDNVSVVSNVLSVANTTINISYSGIVAGPNPWRIDCTDGTTIVSSVTRTIIGLTDLAVTNVTVSNSTPLQGALINITATIANLGSLDANNVTVQFQIDSIPITENEISVAASASIETSILFDTAPYTDEQNISVYIDASGIELDMANNRLTVPITIVPDTFAPTVTDVQQTPADLFENTVGAANLTATVTDEGVGVDTVILTYTANASTSTVPATLTLGNIYAATVLLDWNSLAGSNFSYFFNATDHLGNSYLSPIVFDFIEEVNDLPIVTIIEPNSSTIVRDQLLVQWNIYDEDSSLFNSTVYYRRSNETTLAEINTTAGVSLLWSIPGLDGQFMIVIDVSDGINSTREESAVFAIDASAPIVTLIDPADNSTTADEPVALTYVADDALDPNLVCNLTLDGALNASGIATSSGVQENIDVAGLAQGEHTWRVDCIDTNGNLGQSAIYHFIVDREAPIVVLLSPANATIFTVDDIPFNFTVTDNLDSMLDCELFTDSIGEDSGSVLNNTIGTLVDTDMYSRTHQSYIQCADNAGTIGMSGTVEFSVATDLSITHSDISFNPPNPQEGTSTVITALVRNLGPATAQSVDIEFVLDSTTTVTTQTIALPGGALSPVVHVLDISGLSVGVHTIDVNILPGAWIDLNLTNNNATDSFTVILDISPPLFSLIETNPDDISENTENVIFSIEITDTGVGVDPASVVLTALIPNVNISKPMYPAGADTYAVNLSDQELDYDSEQGEILQYYVTAEDTNNNSNQSPVQAELIEIENDIPIVSWIEPPNGSSNGGLVALAWSVDNDLEGPVNSSVAYWQPFSFAPDYEENATAYFQQGQYIFIEDVGTGISTSWNTAGVNGVTNIQVIARDDVHVVDFRGPPFILDNTPVDIMLDNHFDSGTMTYLIAEIGTIAGLVDAPYSLIDSISINDSRFNLTLDPAGLRRAPFRFDSSTTLSGQFTIQINASDIVGNENSETFNITVDDQDPSIESIVFNNSYTNDLIELRIDATDDFSIQSVEARLNLNGSFTDFTVPFNTTEGLYKLVFTGPPSVGTYENIITVRDQVGHEAVDSSVDLIVALGPDLSLAPSDISLYPAPNVTGDITEIRADITNIGGKWADNVRIAFYANDEFIGNDIINIVTDETAILAWDTTGFASDVDVKVAIEVSPKVFESDYANNNATRGFFIDGPDLVANSLSIMPSPPLFAGEPVMLVAEIENIGVHDAIDTRVTFYEINISLDNIVGFVDLDLLAGQNMTIAVPWVTAGFSGNTTAFAFANQINLPAEVDRSNNMANITVFFDTFVPEQIPDTLVFPEKPIDTIPGAKIRGLTSFDFDQDNKTDFVAANDLGDVYLYRNLGVIYPQERRLKNVSFTRSLITSFGQKVRGATTADFAFDSYDDLVLGMENGSVMMLDNIGGSFGLPRELFDCGDEAFGLATTDIENDNDFDIIVGNRVGHVQFWFNNGSNQGIFLFNRTISTRTQPYSITTGDFDREGHNDIMVGDALGQIEKIIFEAGDYNGFIFADVGSYTHLTTADIDYNGRLDLFATNFAGDVLLFYSRGDGINAEPLYVGNVNDSGDMTSGDYDSDNDIDLMVSDDNGGVTMLMNSLRIDKETIPSPSVALRDVQTLTRVENPYSRRLIDLNHTELFIANMTFVDDKYVFRDTWGNIVYIGDILFTETPVDTAEFAYYYYLNLQDGDICERIYDKLDKKFITYPCSKIWTHTGISTLDTGQFFVGDILDIFNHTESVQQREGYTMEYYIQANEPQAVATVTVTNYSLEGLFSTPNTDYLLSDDVTNTNNIVANVKNINPHRYKDDRDFVDHPVLVPDLTPTSVVFLGFTEPAIPGELITAEVTIENLEPIAIENVDLQIFMDDQVILFGCPDSCTNMTHFDIGAMETVTEYVVFAAPSVTNATASVRFVVNPTQRDYETNYSNNEITAIIGSVPPCDLTITNMFWGNDTIVEGEPIVLFANITNLGSSMSYYEDVWFYGLASPGDYWDHYWFGIIPTNIRLNCSPESPDYIAAQCDGIFRWPDSLPECDSQFGQCRNYSNIGPGESLLAEFNFISGDRKFRSQGAYVGSVVLGNIGSSDHNLTNNALWIPGLTILPSQVELIPSSILPLPDVAKSPYFENPNGQNINLTHYFKDYGGYDAEGFDVLVYLDNNDSKVIHRFEGDSITNHTEKEQEVTIDWSTVPEGDHRLDFYLDYGNDTETSTAVGNLNGIMLTAPVSGIAGNGHTLYLEYLREFATYVFQDAPAGSTSVFVWSTAGFAVNDTVAFGYDPTELHTITAITPPYINFTPATTQYADDGVWLYRTYEDRFQLRDILVSEEVQQTEFDINISSMTTEIRYAKLLDNTTYIGNYTQLIDVLNNGGYDLNGSIYPALPFIVDATGLNLSATVRLSMTAIAIPGNIDEQNETNNLQSTIFRWKEIALGEITHLPIYPSERDVVFLKTTVSNQGHIQTGPFAVRLYVDGELNQTQIINLSAGGFQVPNFLWTVPFQAEPTYNFVIAADADNVILRENELNNNVSLDIQLTVPQEVNILYRESGLNQLSSFENTNSQPEYVSNPLGGIESFDMEQDASPSFVDYDLDGDMDMFVGSLDGGIECFENTGTAMNPSWSQTSWDGIDWQQADDIMMEGGPVATEPIADIDIGARSAPTFVDLDHDNYSDLVVGDAHGRINTYKRVFYGKTIFNGTAMELVVRGSWLPYPYNLTQVDQRTPDAVPKFADLDNDGLPDLLVGNRMGIKTYRNIGNSTHPEFAPFDFGLNNVFAEPVHPYPYDYDDDSDFDLFVGHSENISLLENIGNETSPLWAWSNFSLTIINRSMYRPTVADLSGDNRGDLVIGTSSPGPIPLRKGYYEPVNLQVINYADNEMYIDRIDLAMVSEDTGERLASLYAEGPEMTVVKKYVRTIGGFRCDPLDWIQLGERLLARTAVEKEYDINMPVDAPENTSLKVTVDQKDSLNGGWSYELITGDCGKGQYVRGSRKPSSSEFEPLYGMDVFEFYVDEDASYEIQGSYTIFDNFSIVASYECEQNWCPIYNLTPGRINVIGGSGDIFRYRKASATAHEIVTPAEPAIELIIKNLLLQLRPGYVEDVELRINNRNTRAFAVDRIAFELYDKGIQTGNYTANVTIGNETTNITYPMYLDPTIIALFTDTDGFSLPPEEQTTKSYKIYIPEGIPLNATLYVRAIEKHGWRDEQWSRSNIDELWPDHHSTGFTGGKYYNTDIPNSSFLWSQDAMTGFLQTDSWGNQDFDYITPCDGCGDELKAPCEPGITFMRKELWIPKTVYKAEQNQQGSQVCSDECLEDPSGITTWVNGRLKSSWVTECDKEDRGYTPTYDLFNMSNVNNIDIYYFGPHRSFDVQFYEVIAQDEIFGATTEPLLPALQFEITGIGTLGQLRRQYAEPVNVTFTNNDDDPINISVLTFDLITPIGKKIHLKTDTREQLLPPLDTVIKAFDVIIPSDVPLGSELRVQVERVFTFPDLLWNRDKLISFEDFLSEDTHDFHWGDTLPTDRDSFYRKRFFAPSSITRGEMILGAGIDTEAYLNSEFQGRGYPGWSPIATDAGLKPGELNLMSVAGPIPDTQARLYSGKYDTGGTVTNGEEDVFYINFGMREQVLVPDREALQVYPDEEVTARIQVINLYNHTLEFDLQLLVLDFDNETDQELLDVPFTVLPLQTKYLEVDQTMPGSISNNSRLQLSAKWNEIMDDKNWLRASNVDSGTATNFFLDDSSWGVTNVSATINEKAIFFRKHLYLDSFVEDVFIRATGHSNVWINSLPASVGPSFTAIDAQQFTKGEDNIITIKATDFDIDSDIMITHFVPVRSTDLDFSNFSYSITAPYSQGGVLCEENPGFCNCKDLLKGDCRYNVEQGMPVYFNFTIRNAGELFSRNFTLQWFARNNHSGESFTLAEQHITMHPFSDDEWEFIWNTTHFGGLYEFGAFADSDDIIIETFELNNIDSRLVYVNAQPEIVYTDIDEHHGYNADAVFTAHLNDSDGNLANVSIRIIGPNGSDAASGFVNVSQLISGSHSDTRPGRYIFEINATDELGRNASATDQTDIFDSLFLNIKTTKDMYYYGEQVRLKPKTSQPGMKAPVDTTPVLNDAYDLVGTIASKRLMTVYANSYDPDGDYLTLWVCRDALFDGSSCDSYCTGQANINPSCSFAAPDDTDTFKYHIYVADKEGNSAGPAMNEFNVDAQVPRTELYSIASRISSAVDNSNDSKTIVTITASEPVFCRFGKDDNFRYHKDRGYDFLTDNCESSGMTAVCNLGDIPEDDLSQDPITNLSRAYISCIDHAGVEQPNYANVDLGFKVVLSNNRSDPVYDSYDGTVKAPGYGITVTNRTKYCVDSDGICIPRTPFAAGGTVYFNSSGAHHFRYVDESTQLRDTTILINAPPTIEDIQFIDITGAHSFYVTAEVDDPEQQLACTLVLHNNSLPMEIMHGLAIARIEESQVTTVNLSMICSDSFVNTTSPLLQHTTPNVAPFIFNIPDISLTDNGTSAINLSFFARDLEADSLSYSIISNEDGTIAGVIIAGDILSVQAKGIIGSSEACVAVSDPHDISEPYCFSVFVESGDESRLKNNEVANTTVRIIKTIDYIAPNTTIPQLIEEETFTVLPGAVFEADLSLGFAWDSTSGDFQHGNYTVTFRAVDELNNTLVNRDGTQIIDKYNFTIIFVNTPPEYLTIPNQTILAQEVLPMQWIDLREYAYDPEHSLDTLNYYIVNQSNSSVVNCTITGFYLTCTNLGNRTGENILTLGINDTFEEGNRTQVTITSVPPLSIVEQDFLTYTFISDTFNVTGDNLSNVRIVDVAFDIIPGEYVITVIVSDGIFDMIQNMTVTVQSPTNLTLLPIGDKEISENETLIFDVIALGAHGNVTFSIGFLPIGATFVQTSNTTGIFNWTPGFDQSGNYTVEFNASTNYSNASETIIITVLNTNRPPVLSLIENVTAREGDLVSISPNATDPDNENNVTNDDNDLTFFFTLPLNASGEWQTHTGDAGSYNSTVTVSDGRLNDSQNVSIQVVINNPPYFEHVLIDRTLRICPNLTQNDIVLVTDVSGSMSADYMQSIGSPRSEGYTLFEAASYTLLEDQAISHNFTLQDGVVYDDVGVAITGENSEVNHRVRPSAGSYSSWLDSALSIYHYDPDGSTDPASGPSGLWNVQVNGTASFVGPADIQVEVYTSKIDAAKLASNVFIEQILNSTSHRIGTVSYSSSTQNVLALTDNQTVLKTEVAGYEGSGSTCICCGINSAVGLLQASVNETSIVVMSDGIANAECSEQGVTPDLNHNGQADDGGDDAIQAACDAYNDYGIVVHSIGLGTDVDINTMIEIANCSNGEFYHANDSEELLSVYENVSAGYEAVQFAYDINCTDPDGDTVTYSDDFDRFNIDNTTGIIDWDATIDDLGIYNITITCSDYEFDIRRSFALDVTDICWFENISLNLTLKSGWNLISIPLILENASVEDVFKAIYYSKLFSYDSGWFVPTEIDYRRGYWIRLDNDTILTVEGLEPENTLIPVYGGWNLIGYPSLALRPVNETLTDINYTVVLSYNNQAWLYYAPTKPENMNSLNQMGPGYGYWVRFNEAGSLFMS